MCEIVAEDLAPEADAPAVKARVVVEEPAEEAEAAEVEPVEDLERALSRS